ncbi:nucleotidyltransferase family protein [Zavarzinia compransoris]|uniref:Nucleotidyltransferase-like domain-containing protein n=1 Tax=Zavarzinia compransoris TaxID=1264899 RepID=A0A317E9M4_9PROT|nr:GSU2403 family nucleotidyltransferase fold protein [Zavarzinia compransoris]PWR23411.1 hypothetical protein DKG75_02240 [Zavarzinia compransoris]TDP46013.1 hypothetical protein DES42_10494 [Zavarzinia compransoris]
MAIRRYPLSLQTSYADLVDKLEDQALQGVTAAGGSYVSKTVKAKRYWYFQTMRGGKRVQLYCGPESAELLDRIARSRRNLSSERERRDTVRALARGYRISVQPKVGRVLAALADAGVFRLRAVLVGTAAYQTYGPMLGVGLPAASLMTEDIDLAQFHSISIAIEDKVETGLIAALQAVDPGFAPVTQPFYEPHIISFQAPGGLKVEFLSPMRGPTSDTSVPLPALDTAAQPLRFLDFLIYREIKACALYGAGILLNVPDPTRYALHKLIISQRPGRRPEKAAKDVIQAQSLLDVLCEDRPGDVGDYWHELAARGPKWVELARRGARLLRPDLAQHLWALAGGEGGPKAAP